MQVFSSYSRPQVWHFEQIKWNFFQKLRNSLYSGPDLLLIKCHTGHISCHEVYNPTLAEPHSCFHSACFLLSLDIASNKISVCLRSRCVYYRTTVTLFFRPVFYNVNKQQSKPKLPNLHTQLLEKNPKTLGKISRLYSFPANMWIFYDIIDSKE